MSENKFYVSKSKFIAVYVNEEKKTRVGIILPDTTSSPIGRFKVTNVVGSKLDNVRPGDNVLVDVQRAFHLDHKSIAEMGSDGEKYYLVDESDVLIGFSM